ncbi:hypothetical protein LOTGIDRAFT_169247 [Lottia gigantea]|uniref:Uncharacterized protein n=1 Tax=Lottia gigantea TaxID=225164 RepID=V4B523_LOTGI|nr:hypothetical protein LOTGIDRAFT_169247 [Lottia gigantea]ESO83554.1 hypothetical protein LOTGIDRAFT_169247 [Lottia gigantea]
MENGFNGQCSSQKVTSPSALVISVDMDNNISKGPVSVKQDVKHSMNVTPDAVDGNNFRSRLASTVSPKILRKSISFHGTRSACDAVDYVPQNEFITFSEQRVVLKALRSQSLQHNHIHLELNKTKKSSVCPVGSPRMTRSTSTVQNIPQNHDLAFSRHESTPNLSQSKPTKVRFAVPIVTNSSRFYCRRNALCDPEKMIMPQDTREKIQDEAARRKSSMTRKISNFFVTRLGIEGDEDLL